MWLRNELQAVALSRSPPLDSPCVDATYNKVGWCLSGACSQILCLLARTQGRSYGSKLVKHLLSEGAASSLTCDLGCIVFATARSEAFWGSHGWCTQRRNAQEDVSFMLRFATQRIAGQSILEPTRSSAVEGHSGDVAPAARQVIVLEPPPARTPRRSTNTQRLGIKAFVQSVTVQGWLSGERRSNEQWMSLYRDWCSQQVPVATPVGPAAFWSNIYPLANLGHSTFTINGKQVHSPRLLNEVEVIQRNDRIKARNAARRIRRNLQVADRRTTREEELPPQLVAADAATRALEGVSSEHVTLDNGAPGAKRQKM